MLQHISRKQWGRTAAVAGMSVLMLATAAFSVPQHTRAQATYAQLQAQVQALLAQIAALQGGATATSCYSFTRDLTVGSQGADVTAWQSYLISSGHSIPAGATGYFGAQTRAATAAWQAANGVMPPAGYFGPISRAKYNSLCGSVVVIPGDDDDDDDDDDFGNGNEASLEEYDAQDGDDANLEEGETEQEIMEFEFDVEDADVRLQRIDVTFKFTGTSAGEEDPWRVFEAARLMLDGREIVELDELDDKDNWDEEGNDAYSIRFTGINRVIREGDTAQFVLAVDVANGVDGVTNSGANAWDVYIDDNGIRALDEAGIDQYAGDDTDIVGIEIEEAGRGDELTVRESDDDPDATVLEVDDNARSSWQTVGVMELSAEGDIQINELPISIAVGTSTTYGALINDARIVIDGDAYDDFSITGAGTALATLTFDLDGEDIVIEDEEEVDIEIQLAFRPLARALEGSTVQVLASSSIVDTIDAEGFDSDEELDENQLDGSYEGEIHTLRSAGISLSFVDATATAPAGNDESRANYTVNFRVTAFGDDFYIKKSAERDASADGSDGVEFVIQDSSGGVYESGNAIAALTKAGSASGDTATHFRVPEGQSRTFRLLVTLDNDAATTGFYRVQFTGVGFDEDGFGTTADHVLTTGLENFDTDSVFVDDENVGR